MADEKMVGLQNSSKAYIEDNSPASPRSKFKRLSLERALLRVTEAQDGSDHSALSSNSDTESPLSSGPVTPRSSSSSDPMLSPRSRSMSAGHRLKGMRFSPRSFETLSEETEKETDLSASSPIPASPSPESSPSSPLNSARQRTRSMRFSGTLDPLTEGIIEEDLTKDKSKEREKDSDKEKVSEKKTHLLSKSARSVHDGMRKSTGSAPVTPDKKVIALKMSSLKSPRLSNESPGEPLSPRQLKSQQALQKLKDSGAIHSPSSDRSRVPIPPPKPTPIILFVGSPDVGKSSLVQRLCHGTYGDIHHRVSKFEQTIKFEFGPGSKADDSLFSAKPSRLSISSQSISEAEEDETSSEDTSSSSFAEKSASAPSLSSSSSVARIDFLETAATFKDALSRGVSKKLIVYAFDLTRSDSLDHLEKLLSLAVDEKLTQVLVGLKADGQAEQPSDHSSEYMRPTLQRKKTNEGVDEAFVASPMSSPLPSPRSAPMSPRARLSREIRNPVVRLPLIDDIVIAQFAAKYSITKTFKISSKTEKGLSDFADFLRRFLN